MSRIGQKPVTLPSGVSAELDGRELTVKGKNGELHMTLVSEVVATYEDDKIVIAPRDDSDRARAMWGMQRTLVNNMVTGVDQGFTVNLEIRGVGYRASVEQKTLRLQLGFSHDIEYPIPDDIAITCERPTSIAVFGSDRQRVGQAAGEIRAFRKPEPYKGKGIRYVGEVVHMKEGKKK